MDLNSVGTLLKRISIHYPRFRNHIVDANGMVSKSVAEEWQRRLGYLDLDEALAYLDEWLDQPEDRRKNPPDTSWFSQTQRRNKEVREAVTSEGIGAYMITPDGYLTNLDQMEFAYPGLEDTRFYHNSRGDIAYKNEHGVEIVAIPWETWSKRKKLAEQMKREAEEYKQMMGGM